jgi:site-specific DNA recombinase
LLELEAKRDKLKTDVAQGAASSAPPALHPNLAEVYRRKIVDLETALDDPAVRGEAALALRGLIDTVALHPGTKRGEVRAELHGELTALIALGSAKAKTRTSEDVRVSLVAGRGFEPLTFRL